jgi:arylsulfatase A-like enzyme
MKSVLLLLFVCAVENSLQQQIKRNVVVVMADDLGYNDVSFRGSDEIRTPNLDALAYNGVILNRFYTPPLCTPSRSSFMTGKYPYRLGMQHFVIVSDEPWAVGKEEKFMPEYFKEAGYSTAMVGKWHLGFYQQQFIPTKRGYDKFFGYLGPYIGYYDYSLEMFNRNYSRGYDMRRNERIDKNFDPIYATDLFTRETVKVIEEHDKKKPLFLVVNHLAPHAGR